MKALGLKGSLGQSVEAVSQTKQMRMYLGFLLSKRQREKYSNFKEVQHFPSVIELRCQIM